MLRVGPASAGADPGPSCYGRGGEQPTVTDANVLCGLVRPEKFFGGNLRLRSDLALAALSRLAGALEMEPGALAEGIVRVANSNMMDAIRLATLERGHDPRDYSLVAFGGAGGLHACSLAEDLEIATVLVPRHPGLLSAYGLLVSDFRREFVRTELTRNADVRADRVLDVFADLENRGRREFERYHVSRSGLVLTPSVDLRYLGQELDLNIAVDLPRVREERLHPAVEAFHVAYDRRCGHSFPDAEVEVVNYRLTVTAPNDAPSLRPGAANGGRTGRRARYTREVAGWIAPSSSAIDCPQGSARADRRSWRKRRRPRSCRRAGGSRWTAWAISCSPAAERRAGREFGKMDPVRLNLVTRALESIPAEMSINMLKAAYSSIVREAKDFATNLFDRHGRSVTQSEQIPILVAALGTALRFVIEKHPLASWKSDELVITNDPYHGGQHLNDIALFMPIFVDGERVGIAGRLPITSISEASPRESSAARPRSSTTECCSLASSSPCTTASSIQCWRR